MIRNWVGQSTSDDFYDLCDKYGVEYKTDTWGRTLKRALSYIGQLGQRGGVREVVRSMA